VLNLLLGELRTAPWKGSPDLSVDTIDTLIKLMLAQAQKCFFEKAREDGKSSSIMAKLSADCAAFYQEVSSSIGAAKSTGRPIGAMSNDWLEVVEWNRLLFDGLQQYYLSKVHLEAFEYGKQLARLTYATNKCAEAVKACAGAADVLRKQFVDAHAKCLEEHTQAKKDNDLIYNEKVPAFNTLDKPARMASPLVKTVVPPRLLDPATFADPEPLPAPPAPEPPPPSLPTPAPQPPNAAMAGMAVGDAAGQDEPPPPSFEEAETLGIEQLVAMGFDREKAAIALKAAGGSVQQAANALTT